MIEYYHLADGCRLSFVSRRWCEITLIKLKKAQTDKYYKTFIKGNLMLKHYGYYMAIIDLTDRIIFLCKRW